MTAQQIINDVAHYYGITPGQLIHGDKHRIYADPRHVAAYCLHVRLGLGYSTIGRMLGGKCHATIIYAVNKVGDWMRLPQLNRNAAAFVSKLTDKKTPCD
jgi:chromosomal replication initiator protein